MRREATSHLLILAAVLALAGLVVAGAMRGAGPLPGDVALTRFLQGVLPPASPLSAGLSAIEIVVLALPPLAIMVALALRRWSMALLFLLAALVSLVTGELLLKDLVARPRPTPPLVQVYDPATSYGFPSTTTLLSLVVLGSIGYSVWRSRAVRPRSGLARAILLLLGLLVLLIGLSRIYLGAHWPTDILGSLLVGGAWLALLVAVYGRWQAGRATQPAAYPAATRSHE